MADTLPSLHDPRVAAAFPNAMINDVGEVFYADNPDDAAWFAEEHGARPVDPGDCRD